MLGNETAVHAERERGEDEKSDDYLLDIVRGRAYTVPPNVVGFLTLK